MGTRSPQRFVIVLADPLASPLLSTSRMIPRWLMASIALAFLLAGPVLVESAAAEGASVPSSCPTYRAYLRSARVYLERGDRAGALRELRGAQEALDSCIREDAEEISLAACRLSTPTG